MFSNCSQSHTHRNEYIWSYYSKTLRECKQKKRSAQTECSKPTHRKDVRGLPRATVMTFLAIWNTNFTFARTKKLSIHVSIQQQHRDSRVNLHVVETRARIHVQSTHTVPARLCRIAAAIGTVRLPARRSCRRFSSRGSRCRRATRGSPR